MSDRSLSDDIDNPRQPADFLAHVRRKEDGSFVIHELEEHLRAVGNLAAEFASTFGYSVKSWRGNDGVQA